MFYSWMCLLVFPLQSVTRWLSETSVPQLGCAKLSVVSPEYISIFALCFQGYP